MDWSKTDKDCGKNFYADEEIAQEVNSLLKHYWGCEPRASRSMRYDIAIYAGELRRVKKERDLLIGKLASIKKILEVSA